MKVWIQLDGKTEAVDVQERDGRTVVSLDGTDLEVDACWVGERCLSLLIDGRSYDLLTLTDAESVAVVGSGKGVEASLSKRPPRRRGGGAGAAEERLTSPMPGTVVDVLVKEGDEVDRGQGIVIVEAMKMENELRAGGAGVVKTVFVKAGEVVDGGAPLVEIGPAAS